MKNDRQRRIKELLETENLRTQSEISQRLIEEGYNATQATVSRDLKTLCLNKSGGKKSGSYSISASGGRGNGTSKRYNDIRRYIVSVKSAMNIVVVKTEPGFAQAIAGGVDGGNHPGVLGCVAGDDTIIIVATDTLTANEMVYGTGFFPKDEEEKTEQTAEVTEENKEAEESVKSEEDEK